MHSQNTKEIFYYKIPVFVVDLLIHTSILLLLLYFMPQEQLAPLYQTGILDSESFIGPNSMGMFALLFISFCFSISLTPIRLHERRIRKSYVFYRAIKQSFVTLLLFVLLMAVVYKITPRHFLFQQSILTFVIISIWHYYANRLVRFMRNIGYNQRSVLIVGADTTACRLYSELFQGRSFTGYRISGFFTSLTDPELPEGAINLGRISDCWKYLAKNRPDEIYCSLSPADNKEEVDRLIKHCNDNFIEFFFVPTLDGYPKRHVQISRIGMVNVIKLREEPLNNWKSQLFKRGFDILISGIFLCTLYPFVALFVWLGNKISGNVGPLYFKQNRTGYNGKSFPIYKFRSMRVNADADKVQATKDDPRKTPFGNFLRKSSIDELPQFINVFKGDMSIIGPRPHMEFHTEMYSELIDTYMVRHLAKPGITGWAQVNGCRGETKTTQEMANRVEHDIWYIEHWSMWLDVTIFFKTIWQVIPGHDKQAY